MLVFYRPTGRRSLLVKAFLLICGPTGPVTPAAGICLVDSSSKYSRHPAAAFYFSPKSESSWFRINSFGDNLILGLRVNFILTIKS